MKPPVLLNANYAAFLQYLKNPATDAITAHHLKRLLFRMLGIYHGASLNQPASLDFSENWLPDNYLQSSELTLGYETPGLTFMDVYFLNALQRPYGCHFLFTGVRPWRGKARRLSGQVLCLPKAQR